MAFVRQATLPWIPGQASLPRRRGGMRGLGDCVRTSECFMAPCPCVDGSDSGTVALPFPYLSPAAPARTTKDNWDSKTADSVAGVCFQPLFPWVGSKSAAGAACVPVIAVKSPWPLIITAGLGAFLGFKLLGGRR